MLYKKFDRSPSSKIMSKHSEYKKVLTFFTASALFSSFSNAILPVHFLDSGVTLLGLAISHLLPWLFHPLLLFVFRKFSAKKAMVFAIVISRPNSNAIRSPYLVGTRDPTIAT